MIRLTSRQGAVLRRSGSSTSARYRRYKWPGQATSYLLHAALQTLAQLFGVGW